MSIQNTVSAKVDLFKFKNAENFYHTNDSKKLGKGTISKIGGDNVNILIPNATYIINSVTGTSACEVNKQSTITVNATASKLPAGSYAVLYNIYGPNKSAMMTVNSSGVGTFVADVSEISVGSSATVKVNQIGSSVISSNNSSNSIFMYPSNSKPDVSPGYYQCDGKWNAQWSPISNQTVDGYYLDVALDSNFTIFLPGFNDKYVGNSSVGTYLISGLQLGGTYYYRVRSDNYCGASPYSNTITMLIVGDNSSNAGTIAGGASSVCVGNTTQFTISGSNPSTGGQWSIFNQTGSATISSSGVVTGVTAGSVKVVFTNRNGSCGTSTTKDLTITAGGTVSNGSSTPTVCINNVMPAITHSTTGFTGISGGGVSGANGLPTGVSATWGANIITIIGTPTVSGTFNYSIPLTGGCNIMYATGKITVNPNLPASVSIASNPNSAICAGTSVTFTATPINGGTSPTYQWQLNGTPISGATSSSYTTSTLNNNDKVNVVMVSNASPCLNGSPVTSNIIIQTTLDKTLLGTSVNWSGTTNWSPSGIPSSSNCVNIPNGTSVFIDINAAAQKITVASNGKLTINKDQTLTISDALINNSAVPDNITVASDGNLIQINNTTNIGNITAKKTVTALTNNGTSKVDYVYWSSPVSGQNLQAFSPGTPANMFLSYRESNDRFYQTADTQFQPGKGYAIQAEPGVVSTDFTFRGVPNNGDVKVNLTKSGDGYNMIGNPYPSNINFDALYEANKSLLFNTVYFWKNNSYTQYQQGSSYGGNNYVVYNATGGSTSVTNGTIKVGQSVIVQSQTSGTLTFKNAYRVKTAGTFYQKNAVEKDRFWLNLISPTGIINSQLVGYIAGATDDFDDDYDAEAFDTYSDLFFSALGDKELIIQGKANNFTNADDVHLGANFFQSGSYTIALDKAEGIFANGQNIYLKDNEANTLTNLSENPYTFQASKGLSEGRFQIVYKAEQVLATDNTTLTTLQIYRQADDFVINSPGQKISNLEVYDTLGRLVYKEAAAQNKVTLAANRFSRGILILKVNLQNGEVVTKKVRY